jgi:thiamine monophosphate synthase
LGNATSIPWCSIGAVTMKMMSSTSMTSTNGVMLISDRMESSSWEKPPLEPRKDIR